MKISCLQALFHSKQFRHRSIIQEHYNLLINLRGGAKFLSFTVDIYLSKFVGEENTVPVKLAPTPN